MWSNCPLCFCKKKFFPVLKKRTRGKKTNTNRRMHDHTRTRAAHDVSPTRKGLLLPKVLMYYYIFISDLLSMFQSHLVFKINSKYVRTLQRKKNIKWP